MKKWRDLGLSYRDALHGAQSGVTYEMEMGSPDTSPKHLRVGINSSMVEHAALAHLLIEKGIITAEEYQEALRLAMNDEVASYEQRNPRCTFR